MRRGLLLGGLWGLGVVAAMTLAFAAVGRVASGVAPHDVARLSQTAVDNALNSTSTRPSGVSTTSRTPTSRSTTSTTREPGPTVTPPPTSAPTLAPTSSSVPPRTTVTAVSVPPPAAPHNTVTTSQGGTLFTRCSGPDTIVFVAAVPKTGYERIVNVEEHSHIEQSFVNAQHESKIEAECSDGVVHAHVEEESADD